MAAGKICLITGSTSGIGKATALSLASLGATTLLVSRNKERGGRVRNEIAERTGSEVVPFYVADLSSQEGIRKLADEVRTNRQRNHMTNASLNSCGMSVQK